MCTPYPPRLGIPFADERFDGVYHAGLLKSFPRGQALPFLRECRRVLRPGGIVRVTTNDADSLLKAYLEVLASTPQEYRRQARALAAWPARPAGCEAFSDSKTTLRLGAVPLLAENDISHLHWVAGFIEVPGNTDFLARKKKIVWTLHDLNLFTGGCHYADGCDKYLTQCGACPQLGSNGERDLAWQTWKLYDVSWGQGSGCPHGSALPGLLPRALFLHVYPRGFRPVPGSASSLSARRAFCSAKFGGRSLGLYGQKNETSFFRHAGNERELQAFPHIHMESELTEKYHADYLNSLQAAFLHRQDDLYRDFDFQGNFVYFPLHLQPEMATLPLGGRFNDQILAVECLRSLLSPDWNIIIKENPHQTCYQRGP